MGSGWTDSPLDHVDPSTGTSAAGQNPVAPSAPATGEGIRLEKPAEPATDASGGGAPGAKVNPEKASARGTAPTVAVETIPTPLPTATIAGPLAVVKDPPLVPVRPNQPATTVAPALPAMQQRSPADAGGHPVREPAAVGTATGQTT
ncbi:MAG: hypothetical protein EBR86_08110 [Planctomycetia bacterium]|nr:hypothetical protein [Planctomycetia bacterium]